MEDAKNRKTLYAVISFAAVIIPVALDMAWAYFRVYYSRNFQSPAFLFALVILRPIVVSILIFTKISLQKNTAVKFSRIINISAAIVFVIGVVLLYKPLSLQYIIVGFPADYPMLALIFCLQLCSLVYDLLPKRSKPD